MMLYDPANITNDYQTVTAGGVKAFLFCPTFRAYESTYSDPHHRNSHTPFMKGFRERLQLGSSSGTSFRWRRIVFETKGIHPATTNVSSYTSAGYKRTWKPMSGPDLLGLTETLFEGSVSLDWSNYFMGKVDRNIVTIRYDKTVVLRGGNASAHDHDYNLYHPFNRTLRYQSEENGITADLDTGWAANGRAGMGDVFILDLFVDIGGNLSPADILYIRSQSTLYWHEK